MTEPIDDINNRLAQLEARHVNLMHSHTRETHDLNCRINDLETRIGELTRKAKPLPFMKELAPADVARIVKLRADLFDNGEPKKGKTKYVLKVFVWMDDKNGNRGTIMPFEFLMNDPIGISGHIVHKPRKDKPGVSGTVRVPDHVATLNGDSLLIQFGSQSITMTEPERIQPKPDSPIARWYWNRTKTIQIMDRVRAHIAAKTGAS